MKKIISLLLACAVVFGAVFLCSCGEEKSETESKASVTSSENKKASSSQKALGNYLKKYVKGDNPLYGAWKLKSPEGLIYVFRNDDLAEMVTDSEGYFSALNIDESKKTLSAQFVFGIDGEYKYALSDDEDKLTLTPVTEGKDKLKLTRQDETGFIPDAPENPVIDQNLLGWWSNGDGMTYYFGDDGIMYANSLSFETCYTYSAENGKIKAVYQYYGEEKENFTYSVKGKTLTINGEKYKKSDEPD